MNPTLRMHLALGRVSNLPTVWSNALAGAALAGAGLGGSAWLALMLALSLFYTGGMYLNDAFDAELDAQERAARPIPMGEIGRGAVFLLGSAMLAIGIALGFLVGSGPGYAGAALAIMIVLYDWLHKRTEFAPLLMGACRFLVYLMAALAAVGPLFAAIIGALGLFAHVVGLTFAARQEAFDRLDRAWPLAVLALPLLIALGFAVAGGGWLAFLLAAAYAAWGAYSLHFLFRKQKGDVPRAVIGLIAAISLYDAVLIAAMGLPVLAIIAALGFPAVLALQRIASGT